ncbi:MAG: hypothetical protein ACLFPV_13410 [Spirochaetaceae bacterium]
MATKRWMVGFDGWKTGTGPDSDVVIASRVSISRNLLGEKFPGSLDPDGLTKVSGRILSFFEDEESVWYTLDLGNASPLERQFLMEESLLPPETEATGRFLLVRQDGQLSVLINVEDHLRLGFHRPGLDFGHGYSPLTHLEERLESKFPFASSLQFGYLTADPRRTGDTVEAVVTLHLPGLVALDAVDEILGGLLDGEVSVRWFSGGGSLSLGHLYQVAGSHRVSSEEARLQKVEDATRTLVHYEREARADLFSGSRRETEHKVLRSLGLLRCSPALTGLEAFEHLSWLRLGVSMGITSAASLEDVTSMLYWSQHAHVLHAAGSTDQSRVEEQRAALLQRRLEAERLHEEGI